MRSLLILKHIKVENANAVAGLTYGFPSVTHFLGFVHALSRDIQKKLDVAFGSCAIICHHHQILSHKMGWNLEAFSQTRNPVTKDGKTASFNEEGKLHFEISLVIECNFTANNLDYGTGDDDENLKEFEKEILKLASVKRLAGGYITEIHSCEFTSNSNGKSEYNKFVKQKIRKLLPGFILIDRTDFLKNYQNKNLELNNLEALLDFYTIKTSPVDLEVKKQGEAVWSIIPKPNPGWIVPLQVGYKAISSLYQPGEVLNVRDKTVPFRFVEAVYSLGEWMGLHRLIDMATIFWNYQHSNDLYICSNKKIIKENEL